MDWVWQLFWCKNIIKTELLMDFDLKKQGRWLSVATFIWIFIGWTLEDGLSVATFIWPQLVNILMLPEGNSTIQAQDLLLWELNPWINSEKAHSLSVQDGRDEIITNDGRNIPWLIQCPQTIHAVKCWSVIVITKQNALLCQV
jgi:hypothetical protein